MKFGTKSNVSFKYNSNNIENVDQSKYLGVIVSSKRSLHHKMPYYLVCQARKACFALSLKTRTCLGYQPPPLALKMFDTYILPILDFNNMMWTNNRKNAEVVKIQLRYLKNILGVRRQTPTMAVYAETGRFPLFLRQQNQHHKLLGKTNETA